MAGGLALEKCFLRLDRPMTFDLSFSMVSKRWKFGHFVGEEGILGYQLLATSYSPTDSYLLFHGRLQLGVVLVILGFKTHKTDYDIYYI